MKKHEFYYDSADQKTKIHAIEWIPEGEIKGIVHAVHGVTEHAGSTTLIYLIKICVLFP